MHTYSRKEAWRSAYPYDGKVWIYYPPSWWDRFWKKNCGGAWTIVFYDSAPLADRSDLCFLMVRLQQDARNGALDYLDWANMDGILQSYRHKRAFVRYCFKFRTEADAIQFKLTYLT